ncbi:hypothetical protein [Azohydromonas australica]|nr:hypothetical protein [Azohydromonas australica]
MSRTPNDDRNDSMNPNNPAYQDGQDNRVNLEKRTLPLIDVR